MQFLKIMGFSQSFYLSHVPIHFFAIQVENSPSSKFLFVQEEVITPARHALQYPRELTLLMNKVQYSPRRAPIQVELNFPTFYQYFNIGLQSHFLHLLGRYCHHYQYFSYIHFHCRHHLGPRFRPSYNCTSYLLFNY